MVLSKHNAKSGEKFVVKSVLYSKFFPLSHSKLCKYKYSMLLTAILIETLHYHIPYIGIPNKQQKLSNALL